MAAVDLKESIWRTDEGFRILLGLAVIVLLSLKTRPSSRSTSTTTATWPLARSAVSAGLGAVGDSQYPAKRGLARDFASLYDCQ